MAIFIIEVIVLIVMRWVSFHVLTFYQSFVYCRLLNAASTFKNRTGKINDICFVTNSTSKEVNNLMLGNLLPTVFNIEGAPFS